MIGFKVTAKGDHRGYVRTYEGWSEGDPELELKLKEKAAMAILKKVVEYGFGGGVFPVVDILTKPLQGMGAAAGQLIGRHIAEINEARAGMALSMYDIEVTLSGDFQGKYLVETAEDMQELPKMLALLPSKKNKKEFMGANVLKAVYMAHVNYARHLYGVSDLGTVHELKISIKL